MKKFLSGLLIAGVLMLAGCSGVLDDVTSSPESNGATGTVLLQIGGPTEARTLAPKADDIKAYIVSYQKLGDVDSWETKTLNTTQETTFELEPGIWTFKAMGYADAAAKQAVARGSAEVSIERGRQATASILLDEQGDTNVPGKFKYEVDWVAIGNTTVKSLTLNLAPHEDISGFDNEGGVSRDLLNGVWITGDGTGEDISTSTQSSMKRLINMINSWS